MWSGGSRCELLALVFVCLFRVLKKKIENPKKKNSFVFFSFQILKFSIFSHFCVFCMCFCVIFQHCFVLGSSESLVNDDNYLILVFVILK